jgi:hypothetical protein
MKTHIRAGLTGAMKNIVGINGHKEFLPHYMNGSYFRGGDCYSRPHFLSDLRDRLYDYTWENHAQMSLLKRRLATRLLDVLWWIAKLTGADSISAGGWTGNETLWRMILDLNHILYFHEVAPPHVVNIVDGIIAGQGEGPLKPTPKKTGIVIAGENPAYIDAVIAKTMGYNISRIPVVYNAIYHRKSKFAGPFLPQFKVTFLPDGETAQTIPFDNLPNLNFTKPKYSKRAEST